MTPDELYRRWANAVAEFDDESATDMSKQLVWLCKEGDLPSWSNDEKETFHAFLREDESAITTKIRDRVLYHEITRAVKKAQQEGDGNGHPAV